MPQIGGGTHATQGPVLGLWHRGESVLPSIPLLSHINVHHKGTAAFFMTSL